MIFSCLSATASTDPTELLLQLPPPSLLSVCLSDYQYAEKFSEKDCYHDDGGVNENEDDEKTSKSR